MISTLQVLVSPHGGGSMAKKAAAIAILATCLLACAGGQAANPWVGKFRALAEKNKQQELYWNLEVQCDRKEQCIAISVLETTFAPEMHLAPKKEAPLRAALLPNERITERIKSTIAGAGERNVKEPEEYDPSIYRQIALPGNLLECRGGNEGNPATICLLSGKLIGSEGRKSEWLMLVPDMNPNNGCPDSFCPVVLNKLQSH